MKRVLTRIRLDENESVESDTPPLIRHLEGHFGRIAAGWRSEESLQDLSIQYVEFRGGEVSGVTVLSTLGLSRFNLGPRQRRQELFIMMKDDQFDNRLPAILDQVVCERIENDESILRGEAIAKHGYLPSPGKFVALYATLPVYYPEAFWTFRDEQKSDKVAMVWLLPIKRDELHYIRENGWSKFEDLLNNANFDLFDLDRPSVLLMSQHDRT